MGIVFRQSAKTSIIVLTGAILGALIMWLSTKYIPGKHEYGFTQDFAYKAITISQILLFGTNNSLVAYIHKFTTDDHKKKLLITFTLAFPFAIIALFTILYYLLRTKVVGFFQPADAPMFDQYFGWLPVYTLLLMFQTLMEAYLSTQMKVAIAAFLREVALRILNIGLIFLFAFGYISFSSFVISTILMYSLLVAVYFVIAANTRAFGLSSDINAFSRSEYKEVIHFAWYHFLLNVAIILMSYMDMLLISHYDKNGFGSAAIYRVAIFFIAILYLPLKALSPASGTVLMQAFVEEDMDKARDIFSRSSINILIPTVCLAILLTCNLDNAVAVIKNGYAEVAPVFLILLIGTLFNVATGMNDTVLSFTNYYKFNFYLSLALIVVLFLLLKVLIPRYGVYGAAMSNAATILVFNFIKFLFIKRKLAMQPFSRKTLLVILAGIPPLAVGYFFPYFFDKARHVYVHSFIDASLRSTAIIITYMLMLYVLKPSPDLSEYIASVKKNKRLF